jgi:hypothetical protein
MSLMKAEVTERKALANGSVESSITRRVGRDIFTTLIKANEDEDTKVKLNNQELVCLLEPDSSCLY